MSSNVLRRGHTFLSSKIQAKKGGKGSTLEAGCYVITDLGQLAIQPCAYLSPRSNTVQTPKGQCPRPGFVYFDPYDLNSCRVGKRNTSQTFAAMKDKKRTFWVKGSKRSGLGGVRVH